MNEILTIYKPRTLTPLQTIELFKKQNPTYINEKISYAGRLDPMADGVLLLLVGEENKNREKFESLSKTYEFTILLGIQTDTYDILGLITRTALVPKDIIIHLNKILPSFTGEHEQVYPAYSSMHVAGKPLYYWARAGKLQDIEIPKKIVTINSLEILSSTTIASDELLVEVSIAITKVQGDFRQKEILKRWQAEISSTQPFSLITCKATVSSGTYIRSLAHELGQQLGLGAIAYSITRTQVGEWQLKDAITLIE